MLSPAEDFRAAIEGAIETARCMVLLWSKAAAESKWVQEEIRLAIRLWSYDRLVLASLDDTPLPMGLRDLSAIPIQKAKESGTKLLIAHARAIVERERFSAYTEQAQADETPLANALRSSPYYSRANAAALGILIFITLGFVAAIGLWTSVESLPDFPSLPVPRIPAPDSLIPIILVSLALGIAVDAGIAWLWTKRSRLQSNHMPSRALTRELPETQKGAPQVFVSYSRVDERKVDQLVQPFGQLGYAIWIDRQSTGSTRYAAPIVHAIRGSKLVALMCSHNAFASDHVIREIYLAGDYKKPFIVFQLDSTAIPDEVHYLCQVFHEFQPLA
jgi:hypothetical protein